MSAAPLPGVVPARQAYPGGTERHYPLVPSVLIIGERKHYYQPPPLIRATTIYDTPTTVRVQLPAKDGAPKGRQETQAHHKIYAVPDDAAWAELEAAVATFGARLDDLANLLRRLGSYPKRLAAWKGSKTTPNPLCESVARIEDPDSTNGSHWGLSPWFVPQIERKPIARHTPKMLTAGGDVPYFFAQEGSFVLADDADWDELEAAHRAAKDAAAAAVALLEQRLGTYEDARDGRHAARAVSHPTEIGAVVADIRATRPTDAEQAELKRLVRAAGGTWHGLVAVDGEQSRYRVAFHGERQSDYTAAQIRAAVGVAPAAAVEAKALAVVEPALEGIVVMSREEAEEAEQAIIATADNLRRLIDDFDQRRGWMALGHASFRAWAQERFPDTSLPTVYRQRDAALVDRDLGVPVGATPESHARELKHVPSEERAATVGRADELAQEAGRPRQASDVKRAAQERSGGSERVAIGNTASALPAPLAAVAEALRRGNEQAAYEAARAVHRDYYRQAMAAVDARVEGRSLEEALALLAAPAETPVPAATITVRTKSGPREAPALRRQGILALTPAWVGEGQKARLSDRQFTITHIPSGYMILRMLDSQEEAERVFDQLIALDWSPVVDLSSQQMPVALGEQVARIFGLSYPFREAFDAAFARARALGRYLGRAVKNDGTGTKIFVLAADPPDGTGSPEQYESWVDVLARLAELEQPAPAPPPNEAAAALEAMVAQTRADLVTRAAAVGYTLTWSQGGGARLVQAATGAPYGGVRDLGEALERVEALERQAAQVARASEVVRDEDGPGEGWIAIEDESGPTVQILARGLDPVVAEAIAQIAAALRLLALGQAHAVDTTVLDDLARALDDVETHARGTLHSALAEIAADAEALADRRTA